MNYGQVASVHAKPSELSSKKRSIRHKGAGWTVTTVRSRVVAIVGFALLVAFAGGSSRADVQELVALRPMAVLFCAYALIVASREQLRSVLGPLLFVGSLMGLALLQLLPLPPGVWNELPGREQVAETTALAAGADVWRPLSVDPNRTWNAFFALFVPLAALCLVAVREPWFEERVRWVLMGVALSSVVLGLLQAVGGSGLHLYDITHRGYPVGLFANKNHQSILLLWLMLSVCFAAATADPQRRSAKAAVAGALATIAVLFPLLILTGSRAGLLLSLPALMICAWLLFRSPAAKSFLRGGGRRAKLLFAGALALTAGLTAFVFAVLAFSTRQTALSRLFELSAGDDLRALYFSRLIEMALDFFPMGSGLGSFENAFNMYEPAEHLTTKYMNLAHSDPIQLLIEGGLPALLVVLAGLLWVIRAGWRVWHSSESGRLVAVFYCGSIALWLAASFVDYPLRTPLAATLFAALTAQLAILSTRDHSNTAAVDGRG